MRNLLTAFTLCLLVVGCNPDQSALPSSSFRDKVDSDYAAAMADATKSIPFAADFMRLFPANQRVFSYYLGDAGASSLAMEAFLFERYQMRMKISVAFDEERRKIKNFGEPEFQIREVAKVSRTLGGGWNIEFDTDGYRAFGAGEWQQLVTAGGDFSAIGYACKTNSPVAGFADWQADEESRMRGQP